MKKYLVSLSLLFAFSFTYAASANTLLKKGVEAHNKGEYGNAISLLKKAVEKDSQNGDIYRWLGSAYYWNGQYQEAIEACKLAISLPHIKDYEHESWDSMGGAQEKLGNIAAAITCWNKYIELMPDSHIGFATLSQLLKTNKQFDEAITAAKRAIELKPDYAYAYGLIGGAHYLAKRYDEAITAFKKAIELDPTRAVYQDDLGSSFLVQKDYVQAFMAFKKASGLEPDNLSYRWNMANANRLLGNYDAVISTVDEVMEREKAKGFKYAQNEAVFLALRSLAHGSKGSLDEALQDAEKAYSIDSKGSWPQYSLGAAYLDHGRFDESIQLLSQVLNSPGARVLQATAYASQGKIKKAESIYLEIPEQNWHAASVPFKSDRAALLRLFEPAVREHLASAKTFESGGKYQEALSELTQAWRLADEEKAQAILEYVFNFVRAYPSAAELPEAAREHVLRGEMLVKETDFEKAAAEFNQAIRIAPYAARLYYNCALLYAEMKRYPEAIRRMNMYVLASPDAPDARAAKDEVIKWKFILEKEQ